MGLGTGLNWAALPPLPLEWTAPMCPHPWLHTLAPVQSPYATTWQTPDDVTVLRQRARIAEARVQELETMLTTMRQLACEDALTGCLNRRGLNDTLERELARCARKNSSTAVAMLDLDDFKMLNDQYGHPVGDAALIHLVNVIRGALRTTDVVGRFGGEEFVVILVDTPLEEAQRTVKRLQRELSKRVFTHDDSEIVINFSAGVALCQRQDTCITVIERADAALYRAKNTGKNRVCREQ